MIASIEHFFKWYFLIWRKIPGFPCLSENVLNIFTVNLTGFQVTILNNSFNRDEWKTTYIYVESKKKKKSK